MSGRNGLSAKLGFQMLTRMVSRICTSKLKMVSNKIKISWKSSLQLRANLVSIVSNRVKVSSEELIAAA